MSHDPYPFNIRDFERQRDEHGGKPLEYARLQSLAMAYARARHVVHNAPTKERFLQASADLWEIEQLLQQEGDVLTRRKRERV
jgi:hypothetical protein